MCVQCNASCGRGVRSRSVFCVDGGMKAAPESVCDASLKPHTHEPCHAPPACTSGSPPHGSGTHSLHTPAQHQRVIVNQREELD